MILYGSLGLGDAIYMYPIVKYYAEKEDNLAVVTRYPEIYAKLKCKTIAPDDINRCHISARTKEPSTNIYQDTLIMSGITDDVPLKLDYINKQKINFNTNKKVCMIRVPVIPTKGEEEARVMIPNISIYQKIIDELKNKVYFVLAGQKNIDNELTGFDEDLTGTKELSELFSIVDSVDIVITQPGHCVPIAEALDKKLFTIFARSGLDSEAKRFRFTTPEKILTKETSSWCTDDEQIETIKKKFMKLLGA